MTYPCDAPDKPGNEIIFANGFPTASGRAKVVPTDLTAPDELPDFDYPMVLSTGRMLEHWHTGSMTRRATVLDSIEPEAVALLNRRDLRRMDLRAGDMVRVYDVVRHPHRAEGPPRPPGHVPGRHGLHPLLLRRGPGQLPHQPRARPLRQDPGVQVLRGERWSRPRVHVEAAE